MSSRQNTLLCMKSYIMSIFLEKKTTTDAEEVKGQNSLTTETQKYQPALIQMLMSVEAVELSGVEHQLR